jgi:hypothetical protein
MIMWQNYFVNSAGYAGTRPRRGRRLPDFRKMSALDHDPIESDHGLIALFERDLFGKPVPTFPDHAL